MMGTRTGFFSFLLLACIVTKVTCLTNAGFYDLVKDYVTDVEIIEPNEESYDDVNNDVIELPGGPDDNLDVDYLMGRLVEMNEESIEEQNEDGQGPLTSIKCSCRRHYCKCCRTKTFKVKIWRHRIKFRLRACLKVEYKRRGFEITFTLNGHRVLHKRYSLRHVLSLCYRVPQYPAAKICLKIYNINLRRKRACARLTGEVNLGFKKYQVHLKLGCFRLPILTQDELESLSDNSRYPALYEENLDSLTDHSDPQEELAYLDDDADDNDLLRDLALEDAFQQELEMQNGDEESADEF